MSFFDAIIHGVQGATQAVENGAGSFFDHLIHPQAVQTNQPQTFNAAPAISAINKATGIQAPVAQSTPTQPQIAPTPSPITQPLSFFDNITNQGVALGAKRGIQTAGINLGAALLPDQSAGETPGQVTKLQQANQTGDYSLVGAVGHAASDTDLVKTALTDRILLGTGPLAKVAQGVFIVKTGIDQIKDLPGTLKAIQDAETITDKTQVATEAVAGLGLTAFGAFHLASGLVEAAKSPEADKVIKTYQASPLADQTGAVRIPGTAPVPDQTPISKLTSHEPTDPGTVLAYKNAIQDGVKIDPLHVAQDSQGNLGVEEGKHRLEAYKQLGYDTVPTITIDPKSEIVKLGEYFGRTPQEIQQAEQTASDNALIKKAGNLSPVIPEGLDPKVSVAAANLSNFYSEKPDFGDTTHDLIRTTNGYIQAGARVAKNLGEAIKQALPDAADRQALRDLAEGAVKSGDVKPEVKATYEALKPLTKTGADIRAIADPNFRAVEGYGTRIPTSKLAESSGGKNIPILGDVSKVSELFNNNSRFTQSRQVGKFEPTGSGDTLFGTPSGLGLTRESSTSETFTDKDGNQYKPVATSASEIEKSGVVQYQKDAAKIQSLYHSDTAALKVRDTAMKELQSNPKYGISAGPDIPKGDVEITKIPELNGFHGPRDVVRELEKNFEIRDKKGPFAKLWDGTTNVVTQLFVLNPFAHGLNQVVQSSIAAGNMPIVEDGKLGSGPVGALRDYGKLVENISDPAANEASKQGYLKAGGHIPEYGKDIHGPLYNALDKLHLGSITKLNSTFMSALEANLRGALWQQSVDMGMNPRKAADNVDHYMGDKSTLSETAQRTGLFLHYLKTTSGALYGAIRHPVAESGATANALLATAIVLAVQQGWRAITNNPQATVRFPGELGTAQQIIKAPGQLLAGHAPSILTNHVNPILLEIAQQAFNKDVRTGADVTTSKDPAQNTLDRFTHALQQVSPVAQATQTITGTQTPLQAAQAQVGLYTPNAKTTKVTKGATRVKRTSIRRTGKTPRVKSARSVKVSSKLSGRITKARSAKVSARTLKGSKIKLSKI